MTIPSSVVTIYRDAFRNCKDLQRFSFENGSRLKNFGKRCFANSGLREIALPKTLKKLRPCVFRDCADLKDIYVEDGCEADLEAFNSFNISRCQDGDWDARV